MKSLRDVIVKGERVLVRCDFNVPVDEKGNILDDFKIRENASYSTVFIECWGQNNFDEPFG